MKKLGMTMIELLAAVAIMMIIASLILSGLNVARRQARVTHARRDIAQLAAAWETYYGQYGRFPRDFPNAGGGPSINESGPAMVAILRGGQHDANPRRTPFMDFHASITEMLDPWGERYRIALDENYSGTVTVQRGALSEQLRMSVAIWSAGPDRVDGTRDDVIGWRSVLED